MTSQYTLYDPPADAISAVVFSPTSSNLLLVASWDKSVRLYEVHDSTNQLRQTYYHSAAVLDCCISDGAHFFSGGLDMRIKMCDVHTANEIIIGNHDKAVRCIEHCAENNFIVSGSWDMSVRLWDPRARVTNVGTYPQPNKVFAMDVVQNKLVFAMAGRHVYIYDVRNMQEPLQRRESSLKYMTRCVRCMPNGAGYASSSIEGRVAVEFFDPSQEVQNRKYAFKCHRKVIDGVDTVYPVNALAFHPIHGTFASGGGDGVLNIWDGFNKKRLRQFPQYPSSIASLSFSCDGRYLAVASSYTFEEGEKDHPPDEVFIRLIAENDCKPKSAAAE